MSDSILEFSFGKNIKQLENQGIYYNDITSRYCIFNGVFKEIDWHENVYYPEDSEYSLRYVNYDSGEEELLWGSLEEIANQLEDKVEYIEDSSMILPFLVWFKYLAEKEGYFGIVEY